MPDASHYAIHGGIEGRERLRIVGRVMHESSASLLDRVGLGAGWRCLDVGCGGGDVTLHLARRVAPGGTVLGVDIDDEKLAIAREEAAQQCVDNVEFRLEDAREERRGAAFDMVYSRFLLTHLNDPAAMVRALYRRLIPGGMIAVEDVDFSGCFTVPESSAFRRYHQLYCATVRRRGGDPDIGPRLPSLLKHAGFEDIAVAVVQPVAMEGEPKLINPLTMKSIADAVLADGLAALEEIDAIVRELFAFAADPATLAGMPRVVQAWGRRPRS